MNHFDFPMIKVLKMMCFAVVIVSSSSWGATAQNVETLKSTAGLCHPTWSPYFERVERLESGANVYDSLGACIEDGGLLPETIQRMMIVEDPVAAEEAQIRSVQVEKDRESRTKFVGLNWGPGLMFAFFSEPIVKDIAIDRGSVRVNHQVEKQAIAIVESHYFFPIGRDEKVGLGPFVSIGLVGESGIDPLSLFGGGLMMGFRQRGDQVNSWNVGFGYFTNTEAEILRDGVNDGDVTDEMDPTQLLIKSDVGGAALIFSASF